MANEFIARNGLISNAESTINGNLNAIGNIKITKTSNPTLTIQSESLLSNIESPRILFKGNENINFWIDATNEGLRISNGENPGSSYTLFKNDGQIVTSNKITTVSGGISVSGVDKNSIIFSNVTGGTVLTGINTGDQDLSNLATYDYVNNHTILSTGGTISGSLFIDSAINSTGTTSGAIRTNGGLGVVGNGYFGGTVVSPMFIGELSGNTSTSDKLKNSRTIWGQSFDGTENVSGNMFGVGSISASGKLTISSGGISVAGVSKTENIFTDLTGGTVLKGVNTGDQDLSGLATYDYVNQNFPTTGHNHDDKYLQLTGGIINGDLMITGNTQVSNIKITSLNNGYLPYHVSDLSGLGNSPIYTANSSVGIGTNTLMSTFHVKNYSSGNTENWIITLQNDNNNDLLKPTSGLLFVAGNTTSSKSGIIFQRTGSYGTGNLYFLNDSGENTNKPTISGSTKAVIMSNGNFLIGTSNDTGYKLNVNGSGYFSNGIIVKNVNQYENIFTDLTGGTVLKGVNTGDQDLSGLATYDYVDDTFLPFSGGIISGLLFVNNTTNSSNTTTGSIRTSGGLGVVGNGYFGGTVTAPTFIGNLTGNASSATKLSTSRTIWGQNFNGEGNVSGNLTNANDITFGGYLYSNRSGVARTIIDYSGTGEPAFGHGTAGAGLNTYLDGNNIYLRTSSGHTNNMMLTSTGNVLIGTTTDSGYKLDIAGTLRISGNSIIGGMLNISGNTVINNTLLLNNKLTISSGGISVAGVSKTVNIFTDVTGGTVLKGVNTGDQDLSGLATYDYVNQTFSIIGHKHSSLYTPNGSLESVFIDNSGDLHVKNNLYVSGSTFNTNTETINVNANYIYLRDGATTGLINGEYTGLEAIKYDGINNGRLVFDNTGTARVGDVGFEQPLATRNESVNMLPNGFIYWDSTSGTLKTSTLTTTNISNNYYTQSVSDSRFVNVTGDSMSGKLTISSGGISVAGVSKTENIFTDVTGGTVLRGVNTGDQDLSDLATYDYVDENLVKKTTSIIAGAGLSGGGTLSGNVTLNHADTSSAISLTTSNSVFNVIQNATIAIDTYGHVTSTSYSNINLDDHFIKVTGDTMTGVLYVNNSTNSTNTTTGAIKTSGGLGVVGNGYFGGTVTASAFSGNSSSATKLATARTLWGQSFDGTANVSGSLTGVSTISASGIIAGSAIQTSNNSDYSLIVRNSTEPALYVQSSSTGATKIASFRYGSAIAANGTEVLDVNSAGINVTGTMYSSGNITTPGIVYTNGKANTGDQDLSNLSTYTYVDNTFLKKSGGTMTGTLDFSVAGNNVANFKSSSSIGVVTLAGNGTYGTRLDIKNAANTANVIQLNFDGSASFTSNITATNYLRSDGNTVWHSGNDGSGSGLDADLLDGRDSSSFFCNRVGVPTSNVDFNTYNFGIGTAFFAGGGGTGNLNFPFGYGQIVELGNRSGGYGHSLMLAGSSDNKLYFRNCYLYDGSGGGFGSWKQIAFTDSNVTSATKLQTTRTIWGQNFNGEGNVSGALTGVSTISASGNITTSGIVYTNGKANTGDQDLSNLSTYSYVDNTFLKLAGGTMTGELIISPNIGIRTNGNGYSIIYNDATTKNSYLGAQEATTYIRSGDTNLYHRRNGVADYTIWDSGNDGTGSGLDADLLDGLQKTSFAQEYNYSTTASNSGWYKIKILSTSGWMLYFTIRVYQGYEYYDIVVSGYQYGSNYWYMPKAKLITSSFNAVDVKFGHDSVDNLWVAIPAGSYTGIKICNITNGYQQVSDWSTKFSITNEATLTGTVDSTITAKRPLIYDENAVSATKLANTRTIWGQNFNGEGNVSGALTGVSTISASGNITTSGIVYTNGKANTGDQDLSNLSTYTYVDNTFLKLTGGTMTGAIYVNNSTNSTNTTTGAIRTAGGLGVVGNGYFGGTVTAPTFTGAFSGALSGNASTATKLATVRTIWGQNFDGTGNVSGALTGVSTITATGDITTSGIVYTNGKANTGDQDLSNLSTYTYVDNTFLKKSGGTMTGALTAPNYLRSDGATIWHSGNDGSGSGLDADMLDGIHSSGMVSFSGPTNSDLNNLTGSWMNSWNYDYAGSASVLNQPLGNNVSDARGVLSISNGYRLQISWRYNDASSMYARSFYNGWTGWKQFAFTTSNVASATKLETTRTIWGQNFDGTGNVSGALTGVSTITASGTVTAPTFSGALSGNASSATKLATTRTIWGQNFDGTANVSGAMTGVSTISASGNITTSGIVYTNGKANTGDQDLSNLSTYTYVDNTFLKLAGGTMTGNLTAPNYIRTDGATIWHSGNDGSGSGLDADTLDGNQGSYYTSYTDTAVNGVQIGGRNLLLGTKTFSNPWRPADSLFVQDSDGFYSASLIDTWVKRIFYVIPLELNTEYTVSFYAKSETPVTLEIKDDSSNNYILSSVSINSSTWVRYSSTFKITNVTYTPYITFLTRQNLSTVYIKAIKLEKGNKATDWTPAPEDVDASIALVQTNLNNHTSNTSNPHSVTKAQVGLSNVNNTSDANKPVSTAMQTALNLKANLESPTFTGNVTAPTFIGALSGNANTATKVIATVTGTNTTELVRGNMADNDYFRILVGGTASNSGYAEIATADDGSEPIYVRQYSGVFTSLVRTATLLDEAGNTSFPCTVTGSRFYAGYDSGVANSVSCSDWFRSNGNTGWYNSTYEGGIYMTDTTYVRVYNNKAFKVSSTASDSINTDGGVLANGEIRSNSKFSYGTSAYSQYNSTTNSIDFIFN